MEVPVAHLKLKLIVQRIIGNNVWFKYDLGQKYQAPQVQPSRGLNS